MLKRILITLLLVILVKLSFSQVLIALVFGDKLNNDRLEFGLNIGINSSSITNIDHSKMQYGLNLGLNFIYKFNDRFIMNPSLYFSYPLGAMELTPYETADSNLNELLTNATLKRKLSYFSLPITFGYRVFGLTYIELGPQFGLNTSAEDVFTLSMFGDDEMVYTSDIKDDYKCLDAGFTIGITQKLREKNGVSLKLRYYYGFVDISKNSDQPNQHNSSIYFSAGIPIGGNKKSDASPTD